MDPFAFAAENGHFDCIRGLVDARVDINKAAKDDGSSALYLAAREGPVEVIPLLLEAGADRNQPITDNGRTPLWIAASKDHSEVVRLLLEVGVDKNQATADYGTIPLWIANRKGHAEVVGLLLEASTDRNRTRNRKRNTKARGTGTRLQQTMGHHHSGLQPAGPHRSCWLLLELVLTGTRLQQIVHSLVHDINPRRAMSKSAGCCRQFPISE